MTRYEVYILIVCTVVFTLLTALLTCLIWYIVNLLLRSIKGGLEDEKIKIEYFNTMAQRKSKALSFIDKAFSAVIFLCLFAVFIGAMFVNVKGNSAVQSTPRFQVVASGSMSAKHKKNTYLKENNLNDQFDMFDVIVTHKLPEESELKLYDIVVYETEDGLLVIHRIVGIEEPNEKHPNVRHFLLQGDNVDSPDKFPVLYSQMRGIYRGDKIPFIGSIVMFLQSPAGVLCFILVVFSMIASPIVEKILLNAKLKRLAELLAMLAQTREDIAMAGSFENGMELLRQEYLESKKKRKKPKAEAIPLPIVEIPEPTPMPTVDLVVVEEKAPEIVIEAVEEKQEPTLEEVMSELPEHFKVSPEEFNVFLSIFDEFLQTLTPTERNEFLTLFVNVTASWLPEYKISKDNRLFFREFFIYLGTSRFAVSDALMEKIYLFTVQVLECV